MKITLNKSDISDFRFWLHLNMQNVTWEEQYKEKFEDFWSLLFVDESQLKQQIEKIHYLSKIIKSGPLTSWLNWLSDRLLIFIFLKKEYSIIEISQGSGVNFREVSLVLRNYFVEKFPLMQDKVDNLFQISHITSDNLKIKFSDISNMGLSKSENLAIDDEVMRSLEVTLFNDFDKIYHELQKEKSQKKRNYKLLKTKVSTGKKLKFVRDFIVIFVLGFGFLFFLKFGNEYFEANLAKKISLFEENYFWQDTDLDFSKRKINEPIELSDKELEELAKVQQKEIFADVIVDNERFEVESDVSITSLDTLPKEINSPSQESNRKGPIKGQYRRAFRVLLNSVEPEVLSKEIKTVILEFGAESVDDSYLDKTIPGGIYFNLFVPSNKVKDLFTKLVSMKKATILETRPKGKTPMDKNRVFLWIKSI